MALKPLRVRPDLVMFAGRFAQYLLKRNLQHLIAHVTNHCNFRCQHCFIDFSPKRDLKLEHYEKLGRQAGKLFWLDIAGGEPFLRTDIADIVACFDARVIQIPTNGSLQDRIIERVKEMQKRIDGEVAISFSLDGLESTHEEIRKAPGNWNQVWDTFEKLRELGGINIKINTCLHQGNVDEILPLMKEVRARKPDFHSIILLRGEPMNPEVGLPPFEVLNEIAPKIFEILETYDYGQGKLTARILRNYHRYLWNVSLQTIRQKTQVVPCLAGSAHMVVMGNGDVSSCEMLPPVGNVKETSFAEVVGSSAMREQVQFIQDKKCFCTHNCAMLDSILFRPASIPHLMSEKIKPG